MTLSTPCSDGENDPNDWFIGRDGKQYSDDEIVTREQMAATFAEIDPDNTLSEDYRRRVIDRLEADFKRIALRKRRDAREKCHTECYFRTSCLELALKNDHQYGTWGGYYEEEIRELRREIVRRKRNNRL